ncbi:MAG TPA: S53 family peptidase [Chloroflexota bacterium]|nr:S53 family peptidase [Chloroflexota bacterium]
MRLVVGLLCAFTLFLSTLSSGLAASPPTIKLSGHVLRGLSSATDLGPMSGQQTLTLTIALQPRSPGGVSVLVQPGFQASRITFVHAVGRSQADVDALTTYFASYGLRVSAPDPDRLSFSVQGTVAQIQQALGIPLHNFQARHGRRFHAAVGEPRLPASLAPMVQAVLGLNGVASFHRMHTSIAASAQSLTSVPTSFAASTPGDFTPSDMRTAYDLSSLYSQGDGGNSQTIGIIGCDAFNLSDIRGFESQFGLPQAPISVHDVDGGGSGSDIETTLDLEWSDAIAPNAALIFYSFPEDPSGGCSNLGFYDALTQAVDENAASVLSISLGECELDLSPAEISAFETRFSQAAANGQGVFVASGDQGAYACQDSWGNAALGVSYPASSQYVTAVGGTSLSLNGDGSYAGESAWGSWSECQGGCGSGGGVSQVILEPSWQQTASPVNNTGMRGVPDVAYNSDPATGNVIYFDGNWHGGIGGTSIAAPQWAGIAAIANQIAGKRLGLLSPYLYASNVINAEGSASPPYHDIASGNNLYYDAGPGWDFATGWGSPRACNLLTLIADPSTQTATPLDVPLASGAYRIYLPLVVNSSPSAVC